MSNDPSLSYDLEKLHADLEAARAELQMRGMANAAIRPGFTLEDARKQSLGYRQCSDRVRELWSAYNAARYGSDLLMPQYRKRIERRLAKYRVEEKAE